MDEATRNDYFLWFDNALARELPEGTVAFHVNLYEAEDCVLVELMGTQAYSGSGASFWPGEATFYTDDDRFEIAFAIAGPKWPQWLGTCKTLTEEYVARGKRADVLRSSQGVSIGFVDGDMYQIWPITDHIDDIDHADQLT